MAACLKSPAVDRMHKINKIGLKGNLVHSAILSKENTLLVP